MTRPRSPPTVAARLLEDGVALASEVLSVAAFLADGPQLASSRTASGVSAQRTIVRILVSPAVASGEKLDDRLDQLGGRVDLVHVAVVVAVVAVRAVVVLRSVLIGHVVDIVARR